jgi:CheY-like chemotaxis protein
VVVIPHVIVMDISLAGSMNGIEAAKTIRQNFESTTGWQDANTQGFSL